MIKKTVTQVYIIPINTFDQSLKIAEKLRDKGINVDMDLRKKGISKNLEYANSLNIPFVVFIGEDELKKKKVKLKDMTSGKEEMISVDKIVEKF